MSLIKAAAAVSRATLLSHLPVTAHPRFPDMVAASWEGSEKYGLDCVGMVAQMAIETAWGNFTGKALSEQCNPCGLKWSDTLRAQFPELMAGDLPLAHATFANWRAGCEAHAQHVLAYTLTVLPAWQVIVDPRYLTAMAEVRSRFGRAALEWKDLGGMWAPSADYGTRIETVRSNLTLGAYGKR